MQADRRFDVSSCPAAAPVETGADLRNPSVRRGVIGVLEERGRVLLIRRSAHVTRPGMWCFPGGHVEPGETSRKAIRRELKEELGIETVPVRRLGSIRLPQAGYVLAVWRVERRSGILRPNPAEIAEVRWIEPEAIRTITDGLPSNEAVVAMLSAEGGKREGGRARR